MKKIIAWFGTIASVAGAFIVALQFFIFGYVLFLVGSVAWLYVGVVQKDRALIVLNFAFLTANIIGLYNNF